MLLENFYLGRRKPEGPITATTPLRFVKAYTEQYKPIRVELELPHPPVVVVAGERVTVRLHDLRIAVYEVAGHDAYALMEEDFWRRLRFHATVYGRVRPLAVERRRFGAERVFDHDGRFDHWRQSVQVELSAGQEVRIAHSVHTVLSVYGPRYRAGAHEGNRELPTREILLVSEPGCYRFVKDWSPTRKVDTPNVDAEGSHFVPLYLEISPPSPPYRRVADFGDPTVEVTAWGPDFSGLGPALRPYLESWAGMLVREFLAWQMPVVPLGELS